MDWMLNDGNGRRPDLTAPPYPTRFGIIARMSIARFWRGWLIDARTVGMALHVNDGIVVRRCDVIIGCFTQSIRVPSHTQRTLAQGAICFDIEACLLNGFQINPGEYNVKFGTDCYLLVAACKGHANRQQRTIRSSPRSWAGPFRAQGVNRFRSMVR